ncbi:MAG: DUF3108 domain-containing protein [Bacteroidales bacterium]
MKKIVTVIAIIIAFAANTFAGDIKKLSFAPEAKESLEFDVFFQWGFIWKKAGRATLSLEPDYYNGDKALLMKLIGRTTPAFDKVTRVRDTLIAYTTPELKPLYYSKIVHEGNYRATDKLRYNYPKGGDSNKVNAHVQLYRKSGLKHDTIVTTKTPAFDMLSIFYHLRSLDMAKVVLDEPFPATIISGRHAVKISITYKKEERYKSPSGKFYDCYYFRIQFYDEKGKLDKSDLIEFWMSRDSQRIPVQMAGKLKIGYLRAIIAD